MRTLALLILLACSASGAAGTPAPRRGGSDWPPQGTVPAAPSARASVEADTRLDAVVSKDSLGGPLGEYAAAIGDVCGAELTVGAPFGGRGSVALIGKLEARRLIAGLARVYHLTWTRDPGPDARYTLRESDADRLLRKRTYEAARLAGQRAVRARWAEVRRLASLSERQLRALADRGDGMAHCLLHPRGRGMAQLVFGLPPAVLTGFWSSGQVDLPLSALPSGLQQVATGIAPVQAVTARDLNTGQLVEIPPPPPAHLELKMGGNPERPTVWASVMNGYTGLSANLLYPEGMVRQPPEERRRAQAPRHLDLPDGHPLLRKVTLRDPANHPGIERGERPLGAKPLAKLLAELRTGGVPLIAECEYRPEDRDWLGRQWWLGKDVVDQPLYQALDLLCADFDYQWQYRDGAVLLWPKRWYLAPEQRDAYP